MLCENQPHSNLAICGLAAQNGDTIMTILAQCNQIGRIIVSLAGREQLPIVRFATPINVMNTKARSSATNLATTITLNDLRITPITFLGILKAALGSALVASRTRFLVVLIRSLKRLATESAKIVSLAIVISLRTFFSALEVRSMMFVRTFLTNRAVRQMRVLSTTITQPLLRPPFAKACNFVKTLLTTNQARFRWSLATPSTKSCSLESFLAGSSKVSRMYGISTLGCFLTALRASLSAICRRSFATTGAKPCGLAYFSTSAGVLLALALEVLNALETDFLARFRSAFATRDTKSCDVAFLSKTTHAFVRLLVLFGLGLGHGNLPGVRYNKHTPKGVACQARAF